VTALPSLALVNGRPAIDVIPGEVQDHETERRSMTRFIVMLRVT